MRKFAIVAILVLFGSASLVGVSPRDVHAPGPTPAEKCTIRGTGGPDTLVGTSHHDVICGRRGDDILLGGGGTDTLRGGRGDDNLNARDGIDGGHDILIGGRGKDTCFADNIDRVSSTCERRVP